MDQQCTLKKYGHYSTFELAWMPAEERAFVIKWLEKDAKARADAARGNRK